MTLAAALLSADTKACTACGADAAGLAIGFAVATTTTGVGACGKVEAV
ncbi:hypothetical protein [Psychrobacter sp. BF1]|nr:hypothetical protein [Psychrobacter sp. BF1]